MAVKKLTAHIIVTGKGGHSSVPYKCHDPIVTVAEIINIVTARIAYEFDSFTNVQLIPVVFNAGTKSNVIPDNAELTYKGIFSTEEELQKSKKILTETTDKIVQLNASSVAVYFEN